MHRQHSSGITALVTSGVDTQKRRTPVVEIAGISASLEFFDVRGSIAIAITVRIVQIWIKSVRDFPRIRHSPSLSLLLSLVPSSCSSQAVLLSPSASISPTERARKNNVAQ